MVNSDIFNQKDFKNRDRFHKTVAPASKTDVLGIDKSKQI